MTVALGAAPDGRRAAVVSGSDLPMQPLPSGPGTYREPIGAATGCRQLVQRVLRVGQSATGRMQQEASEDVAYVVDGEGTATVDGERFGLEPGVGLYVPPGSRYGYEAGPGEELLLVSVLSPQPDGSGTGAARGTDPSRDGGGPRAAPTAVHERDQEPLPAGEDRTFRLLIDPRSGCRNVTQFVGSIDRSRAPFHTHTYEEVIYILDGAGIVHVGDERAEIGPGTSIFLPPGIPHCLENASEGVLRLLGVFSPPGSPSAKREDART